MTDTAAPPRAWSDRLLRPTLPELWTFLAVALPVLAALIAPLPTVDLAYHLRAGTEILGAGALIRTDSWTFTAAGQPWLDQQWGAQVILAAAYAATGWTGLAVLRAALVGLAFGLLLLAIRRRAPGLGARTAALLALAAFVVAVPALALRPQLLALACFGLILVLVAGRRERPGGLWLVPIVTVAWANLHGTFVLAPLLAGLAWLEDVEEAGLWAPRATRSLRVAAATAAATLVTPFGLEGWRYAAGLATNRAVTARVSEWQPTLPTDVPGILFWASVVIAVVVALGFVHRGWREEGASSGTAGSARGDVPWVPLATLAAFAALGALTGRGIAWWPGVAVVVIAGLAADGAASHAPRPGQRVRRGSPLNAVVAAALAFAAIAALPTWRPTDAGTGAPSGLLTFAPGGVTAAVRGVATSRDRVWNPQAWGSWLEFAVPLPAYALDSRIELIPGTAWADGDAILAAAPGWDAILDAYGVTIVVAEGGPATPLASALATNAGWRQAYRDDAGSVWLRAAR